MGRKMHGPFLLHAIDIANVEKVAEILGKDIRTKAKVQELCTSDVKRMTSEHTECPLLSACLLPDPAIVEYMIKNFDVNVNFVHKQSNGRRVRIRTPLQVAVRSGTYATAEAILSMNGDVNLQDHKGRTALHLAVRRADYRMAKMLLTRGAQANVPDASGNTPLHVATIFGHVEMAKVLIHYGADLYVKGQLGALPIHIAAKEGHLGLIKLFCWHEMNGNIMVPCYDEREKAPLHVAAEYGHFEAAGALIELLGADVNLKDSEGETPLHCTVLHAYDRLGMKSKDDYAETAKVLIRHGAEVNARNGRGETALHLAARNEFHKVVDILLQAKINPLIEDNNRNKAADLVEANDTATRQMLKAAMVEREKVMNITLETSARGGTLSGTMLKSQSMESLDMTGVAHGSFAKHSSRIGTISSQFGAGGADGYSMGQVTLKAAHSEPNLADDVSYMEPIEAARQQRKKQGSASAMDEYENIGSARQIFSEKALATSTLRDASEVKVKSKTSKSKKKRAQLMSQNKELAQDDDESAVFDAPPDQLNIPKKKKKSTKKAKEPPDSDESMDIDSVSQILEPQQFARSKARATMPKHINSEDQQKIDKAATDPKIQTWVKEQAGYAKERSQTPPSILDENFDPVGKTATKTKMREKPPKLPERLQRTSSTSTLSSSRVGKPLPPLPGDNRFSAESDVSDLTSVTSSQSLSTVGGVKPSVFHLEVDDKQVPGKTIIRIIPIQQASTPDIDEGSIVSDMTSDTGTLVSDSGTLRSVSTVSAGGRRQPPPTPREKPNVTPRPKLPVKPEQLATAMQFQKVTSEQSNGNGNGKLSIGQPPPLPSKPQTLSSGTATKQLFKEKQTSGSKMVDRDSFMTSSSEEDSMANVSPSKQPVKVLTTGPPLLPAKPGTKSMSVVKQQPKLAQKPVSVASESDSETSGDDEDNVLQASNSTHQQMTYVTSGKQMHDTIRVRPEDNAAVNRGQKVVPPVPAISDSLDGRGKKVSRTMPPIDVDPTSDDVYEEIPEQQKRIMAHQEQEAAVNRKRLNDDEQKMIRFFADGLQSIAVVGGNAEGIYVSSVAPQSDASRAGLMQGHQILSIQRQNMHGKTKEEAATIISGLSGQVTMIVKLRLTRYKQIIDNGGIGDAFFIRANFESMAAQAGELRIAEGDIFAVKDTYPEARRGYYKAQKLTAKPQEMLHGLIPNNTRAEQIMATKRLQQSVHEGKDGQQKSFLNRFSRSKSADRLRKDSERDANPVDLDVPKKPAYERVKQTSFTYKRPVVILGLFCETVREKLSKDSPGLFVETIDIENTPLPTSKSSGGVQDEPVNLTILRTAINQNKHSLCTVSPRAIEYLNSTDISPIVIYMNPGSRNNLRLVKQRIVPNYTGKLDKMYDEAAAFEKSFSHLFTATISYTAQDDTWFALLKDTINKLQAQTFWVTELDAGDGSSLPSTPDSDAGRDEHDDDAAKSDETDPLPASAIEPRSVQYEQQHTTAQLTCNKRGRQRQRSTGEVDIAGYLDYSSDGSSLGRKPKSILKGRSSGDVVTAGHPEGMESASSGSSGSVRGSGPISSGGGGNKPGMMPPSASLLANTEISRSEDSLQSDTSWKRAQASGLAGARGTHAYASQRSTSTTSSRSQSHSLPYLDLQAQQQRQQQSVQTMLNRSYQMPPTRYALPGMTQPSGVGKPQQMYVDQVRQQVFPRPVGRDAQGS